MDRGYQHDFASGGTAMYDVQGRERKAATMVAVLGDFLDVELKKLDLLNVGGSTGIIDNYLADHFASVVGVDIDQAAIQHATRSYRKSNLKFQVGDAMALDFDDGTFDAAVCSQVYEHVPDAGRMMQEIFRVLKPGGVCFFAATNRLMWNEPHYNLPLLSVIPRSLAHVYIRLAGKATHYHELHFTYWGLRHLVRQFGHHDYTRKVIDEPVKFGTEYMVRPGTTKARIARIFSSYFFWLMPGFIWVLQKP